MGVRAAGRGRVYRSEHQLDVQGARGDQRFVLPSLWAMNDDAVRAVQRRVDRARRKTLSKSIERLIGEKSTAKSIATAGAAMLIGYQQMVASGEQASLEQILDELNLLVRAR